MAALDFKQTRDDSTKIKHNLITAFERIDNNIYTIKGAERGRLSISNIITLSLLNVIITLLSQ